jgi:tetratricopeptide (TPR) repeat protein
MTTRRSFRPSTPLYSRRIGPPESATVRDTIDQGVRYARAGLCDRALVEYQCAVSIAVDPATLSEIHRRMASALRATCQWDASREASRVARRYARVAGRADLIAEAANAEAATDLLQGRFARAIEILDEALAAPAEDRVRGILLENRGIAAAELHRLDEAGHYFAQALTHYRAVNYGHGLATASNNALRIALDAGRFALAATLGATAIDCAREAGEFDLLLLASRNQAEALLRTGDIAGAEALLGESFGHFTFTQNAFRRLECLRLMAEISIEQQQLDTARRSLDRALEIARGIGTPVEEEKILARLREIAPAAGQSAA